MSDLQKKIGSDFTGNPHPLFEEKNPPDPPPGKNGSGPYLTKIPDPDPPPRYRGCIDQEFKQYARAQA